MCPRVEPKPQLQGRSRGVRRSSSIEYDNPPLHLQLYHCQTQHLELLWERFISLASDKISGAAGERSLHSRDDLSAGIQIPLDWIGFRSSETWFFGSSLFINRVCVGCDTYRWITLRVIPSNDIKFVGSFAE